MRPKGLGVRTRPVPALAGVLLALLVTLAPGLAGPTPAAADEATSARTFEGPTYSPDYPAPPTRAANQSKLWFHGDAWWALLADPTGRGLRVHELMPDHTWRPTSAVVNVDVGESGDAVQSRDTVHVVTRGRDGSLYYVRLSYDAAAREYRAAPGVLMTTRKSAAPASITEDATGILWAGYATATNVLVLRSEDGGRTWGRVIVMASRPEGKTREVASMVAYDDRVGILWSDQATGSFQFASHRNADAYDIWTREVAVTGPGVAGAHISLAAVPGDPSDTLVAAVRTAHVAPADPPGSTQLDLLVRGPDGRWSETPISTLADGLDNPVVQVDLVTRTVHVFASRLGAIVTKVAPLDALRFDSGPGDIFVNGASRELDDPTVAKGAASARSGLVVLASDAKNRIYRHAELSLSPSAPVADPSDHTPPSAPSGLQAQALTPQSVLLSWQAADDGTRWVAGGTGVPVAGYVVTRNGVEVATVTSTAFEDRAGDRRADGDTPSTVYSVTAVDASGNRSPSMTLVVDLQASGRSRTLVLGAAALLGLAVVLTVGVLLYRRSIVRGASLPPAPRPVVPHHRHRTPVG